MQSFAARHGCEEETDDDDAAGVGDSDSDSSGVGRSPRIRLTVAGDAYLPRKRTGPVPSPALPSISVVEAERLAAADGLQLEVSAKALTGYTGVSRLAHHSATPFRAIGGPGSNCTYIGVYASAAEAALARARHIARTPVSTDGPKGDVDSEEEDELKGPDVYAVDALRAKRQRGGVTEYLVKWKGAAAC